MGNQLRFIRLPDVLAKTSLSKTSVYTLPDFPKPIKIKPGAGMQGGARWLEAEIDEWMQSLIQLRDAQLVSASPPATTKQQPSKAASQ